MQGLKAFSMCNGCGKPARDIIGNMLAAQRHHISIAQAVFVIDGHTRGRPTHLDIGRTKHHFITHKNRARTRIRGDHIAHGVEMAAGNGKAQITHRTRFSKHRVDVHFQGFAKHADRVFHPARIIQMILHRACMQKRAPARIKRQHGVFNRPLHIRPADF